MDIVRNLPKWELINKQGAVIETLPSREKAREAKRRWGDNGVDLTIRKSPPEVDVTKQLKSEAHHG